MIRSLALLGALAVAVLGAAWALADEADQQRRHR